MSTRDAERWDIHSFLPPPSLPSPPFIPFSVLLERSAVAVGTVKKGGGDTLICEWAGEEGEGKESTELCNCNNTDDDDPLVRPTETMMKMYCIDPYT